MVPGTATTEWAMVIVSLEAVETVMAEDRIPL